MTETRMANYGRENYNSYTQRRRLLASYPSPVPDTPVLSKPWVKQFLTSFY
jgi:hypothetical protein